MTASETWPPLRYACEYHSSGYAVAARRCMLALVGAGAGVAWQPLLNLPGGQLPVPLPEDGPQDLAAQWMPPQVGETVIVHSTPSGWRLVRDQLAPGRLIGHTVWETGRLPTRWLQEMAVVDEFWVPTQWNKDVFSDAFDQPVHVVPHAVSPDLPEAPPIAIPSDVFVVTVVSAWQWRKRPDLAIEVFLRAFEPDDDVCLVIKAPRMPDICAWPSRQHIPTAAHVGHILQRWPERPRVVLDTAVWSARQVLGLLARSDCFLSTTASEGWGLGAFDAACLGVPVLISGYGGQVEWLGPEYPGLLPYRMVEAVHPDKTLFEPGMQWGAVDVDDAAAALRALYEGELPALQRAAAELSPRLRQEYSADRVARSARAALGLVASHQNDC